MFLRRHRATLWYYWRGTARRDVAEGWRDTVAAERLLDAVPAATPRDKWAWLRSRDVLNFWQISVNISNIVKNRHLRLKEWKLRQRVQRLVGDSLATCCRAHPCYVQRPSHAVCCNGPDLYAICIRCGLIVICMWNPKIHPAWYVAHLVVTVKEAWNLVYIRFSYDKSRTVLFFRHTIHYVDRGPCINAIFSAAVCLYVQGKVLMKLQNKNHKSKGRLSKQCCHKIQCSFGKQVR